MDALASWRWKIPGKDLAPDERDAVQREQVAISAARLQAWRERNAAAGIQRQPPEIGANARGRAALDFVDWPLARAIVEQQHERRASPMPSPGLIYTLRAGRHIKIGFTLYWAGRRNGYPPCSLIIAGMPGSRAVERRVLDDLAPHVVHGREWFTEDDAVIQHMVTLANSAR